MSDDRRQFMKKLAQGTVYAVPLIRSLAAPDGLAGADQGVNSVKEMGMQGMGMQATEGLGTSGFGTEAPWSRPPPGGGG